MSSDGSFIVCACGEAVNIVDSSNASIKSTIEADSDTITALVLSPDDKLLFTAGHSRQIKTWNMETLKCIRSWKGHEGPVMAMSCHASGGLLASAGADRKVYVWDVDGGFCTHHFKGHKGVVTCIMFHPDSDKNLLFSGSDDATVQVWDLGKKKPVATLDKHFSTVTSLALSEDGMMLLSAGRDKVVNLWDLHTYKCKTTVPTYEAVEAVCVINYGTRFASYMGSSSKKSGKKSSGLTSVHFITVGDRGIVRIWNSEGAICLYEQNSSDVTVAAATDDDSRRGFIAAVMLPLDQGLLCVTADQQLFFYSPSENPAENLNLELKKRLVGFNEEIVDMKFLDVEENYLAVATNTEQVRVYDLSSMSCSYVLSGHTDIVLCLDACMLTSQRTLLVTGSKDNSARLWDSSTQRCIGLGMGHMGAVSAVAFSKKRFNFFVSGSSDRTIKVWNLEGLLDDIKEPLTLKAKAVVSAHDKDINSLAVAPDDSLLCSGSQDRTACIWELPNLVLKVTLKGHKRGVWSVEFSPVDKCVITASGDKTLKIWAISDGSCLKTFEGHTSSVLRASYLTRGTQFVSCGADGLVKLWTVKSNECVTTYDQHEDKIWALAVGKKTERIATGGGDAVINLWNDSTIADKEEAFQKEEEAVLRGQDLENAVLDADYTKAIQLAFEFRRPHRLFQLFSELCSKRDDDSQIKCPIHKALSGLGKEEFRVLFEYIREWNTKPKFCIVAQLVLYRAFQILPPTEICEIKGIGEILEGIFSYTQRHKSRIERLEISIFLLDYILNVMTVLEPETDPRNLEHGSSAPALDHIDSKGATENSDHWQEESPEEPKQKASAKKRKSRKSGDGTRSNKKVKDVAYTKVETISLKA